MKYGAILTAVAAMFMLLAALPVAVSDDSYSDAVVVEPTHVDTEKTLTFKGYAKFDTSVGVQPDLIIFVVFQDPATDEYRYENVNKGSLIRTTVSGDSSADATKNYYFEITNIPLINVTTADYYISAFNSFSIDGTSDSIEYTGKTIVPDPDTWVDVSAGSWTAYKINRSVWNPYDPDNTSIFITDEPPSLNRIHLGSAQGSLSGHVEGVIGNNTNNLNDVLVQIYQNDTFITDTRTNSHGDYSVTLPTGVYRITFSRGNYESDPITVTVSEGTNTAPNVTMTLSVQNNFLGFDLAHFLTIIGGIVCAFIIIISIIFQYRRIKKNQTGTDWILDDMEDDEEK